jgi:BlaI family penicillinase repressor
MKLTEAEWQIMNVLWERYPATARGIAERLPQEVSWAYTTIKTLLARLVGKGAVKESKKGNTSIYEPLLTRKNARRNAIKILANQAFDGAFGPLMHFMLENQKLTPAQKQELVQSLKEDMDRRKGGKK